MFGLGGGELLIILLISLVVFGAGRLPELGRGLGQGLRSFKDALKDDGVAPETKPAEVKPPQG
jgi:sec-independent protein translocase protein TatA